MIVIYQLVAIVAHLSLCDTFASFRDVYFEPRAIPSSDQEVVHDNVDIVKCDGGWVKVEACLQFWCAEFEHIIEAGTHHIS